MVEGNATCNNVSRGKSSFWYHYWLNDTKSRSDFGSCLVDIMLIYDFSPIFLQKFHVCIDWQNIRNQRYTRNSAVETPTFNDIHKGMLNTQNFIQSEGVNFHWLEDSYCWCHTGLSLWACICFSSHHGHSLESVGEWRWKYVIHFG